MVAFAGYDIPVLALVLSIITLILTREFAPAPLRRLSKRQSRALTGVLLIILFVTIIGDLPLVGTGRPMSVGMSVLFAIGLGMSGLAVVEIVGDRVREKFQQMMDVLFPPRDKT